MLYIEVILGLLLIIKKGEKVLFRYKGIIQYFDQLVDKIYIHEYVQV